ncbi:hypothetical protein BDV93DRAFT_356207 [Ceratobasidium sp. AG-I]|nr:hypothetical protein BDV93DRAFT_356207 [Ceratobasidium sp. AG-I]
MVLVPTDRRRIGTIISIPGVQCFQLMREDSTWLALACCGILTTCDCVLLLSVRARIDVLLRIWYQTLIVLLVPCCYICAVGSRLCMLSLCS